MPFIIEQYLNKPIASSSLKSTRISTSLSSCSSPLEKEPNNQSPEVMAVSKTNKVLKPLLDDFAQLCGVTVKNRTFNPNDTLKTAKKVVKGLKGRNAVLLANNGALCVA